MRWGIQTAARIYGGYLAANWHLYLAQQNLCETAEKYGVNIKFFHGKGGTIDRGGGESHRAILGQPFSAVGGRIKMTEQGEVVSQKYATPMVAKRNMEQLDHRRRMDESGDQPRGQKEHQIGRMGKIGGPIVPGFICFLSTVGF